MTKELDPVALRKAVILEAAFPVLAQYGYKRSSMEDIAKAAGMSRPALYQHFRNKEDMARHFVAQFYDRAVADVARALSESGPVDAVLEQAFRAKAGPLFEQLLDSPHGMELVEMGFSHAADITAEGNARLVAVFADWLRREANAGRMRLIDTPEALAETMLGALAGIKAPPFAAYEAHMTRLAHLFGAALSV